MQAYKPQEGAWNLFCVHLIKPNNPIYVSEDRCLTKSFWGLKGDVSQKKWYPGQAKLKAAGPRCCFCTYCSLSVQSLKEESTWAKSGQWKARKVFGENTNNHWLLNNRGWALNHHRSWKSTYCYLCLKKQGNWYMTHPRARGCNSLDRIRTQTLLLLVTHIVISIWTKTFPHT